MKFPPSALATKYLSGLRGIEIGGSAHNSFGLDTRNVDYTDDMGTKFKRAEVEMCGEALPVDIVAPGDRLPLASESVEFVISSHVLEHFWDPIGALIEWNRVVKPGGYIMAIVPKPDAAPEDVGRPITTMAELVERHHQPRPEPFDTGHHWSVWDAGAGARLISLMVLSYAMPWELIDLQETDDKVGNGWAFLVQKYQPTKGSKT